MICSLFQKYPLLSLW